MRASTLATGPWPFLLLMTWSVGLVSACTQATAARTELVLVADTDIASLDAIEFHVAGPGRAPASARSVVDGTHPPPRYVGLVRDEGSLGPLTISARGFAGGRMLIERTVVTSFVPRQTRVVPLHLLQGCLERKCPATQSCGEHGCADVHVAADELDHWSGKPPTLGDRVTDAGMVLGMRDATVADDAGASMDLDAGTQARDASVIASDASLALGDAGSSNPSAGVTDCGGSTGTVDLATDVAHCGACERACLVPSEEQHAVASCWMGGCRYACAVGFGNCNALLRDGCEQSLLDRKHCGACGRKCRGNEQCLAGVCSPK